MPVKRASNKAKAKADTLFSLIIRSEGSCMQCGWTCTCENAPKAHTRDCKLTTSHIIGRKYSATRTLEMNAQCICYSCHRRFTDWPREFSRWITDTIGSEAYDELVRTAQTVTKVDWEAEVDRLTLKAKDLGIK